MGFSDAYWWSNDNLRLHYRDYPGRSDRPTILCMPGLTRNVRDFHALAERLSPDWPVIAIDFRGRGESAYAKDAMTYAPLVYAQDVERLIDDLPLDRLVVIGTSLGGIVAMLMAGRERGKFAAVVLNDIGPEIDAVGLARIRTMVGRGGSFPTWVHAARTLGENNAAIYPHYGLTDWLAMAKCLYRLTPGGRVVPDYDANIAEPFRLPGGEAGINLWPALEAIGDVPTLILRGETSDILSAATADAMARRLSDANVVTVPGVGHTPVLDDTVSFTAIMALLTRIAA